MITWRLISTPGDPRGFYGCSCVGLLKLDDLMALRFNVPLGGVACCLIHTSYVMAEYSISRVNALFERTFLVRMVLKVKEYNCRRRIVVDPGG